MTRKNKTWDRGLIPGTTLKVLQPMTYHGKQAEAHDLKFMRDVIKYWKAYPLDLQDRNPGVKFGLIQMRHSWFYTVKELVDTGCTSGKLEKFSFGYVASLVALANQPDNSDSKRYWLRRKAEDASLDIQPFFDQPTLPYDIEFVIWFLKYVNQCTPEVKSRVGNELFPKHPSVSKLFENDFNADWLEAQRKKMYADSGLTITEDESEDMEMGDGDDDSMGDLLDLTKAIKELKINMEVIEKKEEARMM